MSDALPLEKRRRIMNIEPDERMVEGLLVNKLELRDKWLVQALRSRNVTSLASVEEAISRLAGRSDIEFFQPGGMVNLSREEKRKAIEELLMLGRRGEFLKDPIKTQSLMPKVGVDHNMPLMDQLKIISPKALHIFQLLGIQMQLAILIDNPPTDENTDPIDQE